MKHQTPIINNQENTKHQARTFGYWLLNFSWLLVFGYWLLPASAFASEQTYNFPSKLTLGNTTAETTLALPFDILPTISAIDLGGDGTSEIVLGSPPGSPPQVMIVRQDGSIIASWFPYGEKFTGAVAVKTADMNNDGKTEIITAPLGAGGPHIKTFNTFGKLLNPGKFDQNEVSAMAALTPAGQETIITVVKQGESWQMAIPRQVRSLEGNEKTIVVDLSDQKLSYYQNGLRIATHPVSTGTWSFPTPIGEFAVQNKIPRAFSKTYGLYMPYWMAFYKGQYGLHELPEWPNGYKEGANHLGTPVSHGCIRLGVGPAKALYDWATVGAKVIVQK